MKRLLFAMLLGVAVGLAGCEDEEDDGGYGLDGYSGTGVVPESGDYTFSQEGSFSVVDDPATGLKAVRFSRDNYRFDLILVTDGRFSFEHGQIGGTDCPTDGYGISGHFTTATTAEGQIAYATDCRVTSRSSFTAQR